MGLYLGGINLTMGKRGFSGADGVDGQDGLSAYQIAKEQGFAGTEEEFASELINAVETQMLFNRFNSNLTWNDLETVYTYTWTYNGDNYKQVRTEINADSYSIELFVNDVRAGLWTTTIDETNNTRNTVYTT